MPQLLTLRGRHALSPFRVAKLHAALAAARPGNRVSFVHAEYWHYVEVDRELEPSEREPRDPPLMYLSQDALAGTSRDTDAVGARHPPSDAGSLHHGERFV